jgi:hypothetical protein
MQKRGTGKWLKGCLLSLAVTLPLIFGGCGGNQAEPAWNVTGGWYIYHDTAGVPGEQGPDLFSFTQANNKLSGTTPQGQQITGTVSGVDISFSWTGSDGASCSYSGSISGDGATMSGTWTSSNGQSGTWHAIVNAAPAVNVTGNWNIYHTTTGAPGEAGPDILAFAQTNNNLSGTTPQGQQVTGTVSSLSITFSWTGSDGATYTYTGSASATAMSGSWTSTSGQSGTWRATKSS